MQEVILVLHSSTATDLATKLCVQLNEESFFTLQTSELQHSRTDIDITNFNSLINNIEITNKTLCIVTKYDTKEYINSVNKLLSNKLVHEKVFLMCCDTDAQHISMPEGSYYRRFTTETAIFPNTIKLLKKASGICSDDIVLL